MRYPQVFFYYLKRFHLLMARGYLISSALIFILISCHVFHFFYLKKEFGILYGYFVSGIHGQSKVFSNAFHRHSSIIGLYGVGKMFSIKAGRRDRIYLHSIYS